MATINLRKKATYTYQFQDGASSSLEVGKDGDVVIFSGSPFDIDGTCETVVINGVKI